MDAPYQVFEPAGTSPGEVVLVDEFDTLAEAEASADAGAGRSIEWREGGTARVVPQDDPNL